MTVFVQLAAGRSTTSTPVSAGAAVAAPKSGWVTSTARSWTSPRPRRSMRPCGTIASVSIRWGTWS